MIKVWLAEACGQSARVDESTGGSLQPFTYYMSSSDSSQQSTVKRLKNIITAK